ncbi:polysaccharide deacetylase family protein [Oscillospiraceae bacterium MB08-C2-2]|nr:polysaccharide deacetylase family protein [Oscillospiraceae bacterium MB08-C2-2]
MLYNSEKLFKKAAVILSAALLLQLGLLIYGGYRRVVATQASSKPLPIYSVETDQKAVALGINCAWDNADIPQLIDILEKAKVKATFFVAGTWCDDYPESVKALAQAGHEIGSHSDNHKDMAKMTPEEILNQIHRSEEKITALTGERPTLFRTPSGSYSDEVITLLVQEGYYPIQWDCDSVDWKNPSPEEMVTKIMDKAGNGSIMLFHSGAKNTPEALPQVIAALQKKGLKVVPVSQLIHKGPYVVDYTGRQSPLVSKSK